MIAHVQSRDITALPGVKFVFLEGSNEFEDEKCIYGNVSFRDTKSHEKLKGLFDSVSIFYFPSS